MTAMEFSDKVVVITGASSGIGRAAALAFAEHGCFLTITGRNLDNLNSVATLCKSKGAKDVLIVKAEFEKMQEVELVIERSVSRFARIDILVNNAGLNITGNLENGKMDDFDRLFQVNVKSVVRITQQAMPYLLKTKGNVVNISSYCAEKQVTNYLFYCMTKAAVNQFTKTTALDYAPKGVRVNAVCPYAVYTGVARDRFETPEELDRFYDSIGAGIPLGRIGKVDECANAILFMASNRSAWTTGQCLVLDGAKSLVS